MDIKTPQQRSANMAKIKNANSKSEIYIRSLLHNEGLRFRVNYKDAFGKPDIYFTKKKVAIFIHGCYWHRHKDCKYAYNPKSNEQFWQKKFGSNIERDKLVKNTLQEEKIRVLIIWECTAKKMMKSQQDEKRYRKSIMNFILEPGIAFLEI